jgi:transcriptional regulator with XRE-family HTH domain
MHPFTRYRKKHIPPMSMADLGRMLGMDRSNVLRIERGERQVSLALLGRVSALTGIAVGDLRPDLREVLEQAAE